jgi:hypothetical protein
MPNSSIESPAETSATKTGNPLVDSPVAPTIEPAKEFLFNKSRETQEKNLELERRVEELEAKLESSFIRLDKVEKFINKVGMAFNNFFRPKGVNISQENIPVNEEVSEEGYLSQRPEPIVDYEDYANSLRKQGLDEASVQQRIATIKESTHFQGEVNKLPENQIPDRGEITQEQYLQERPTFQDYQKEQIQENDGDMKTAAQNVAFMRQRIQEDQAAQSQQTPKPKALDKLAQNVSQAFTPQGVNINPSNQIAKQEYTSPGQLVDDRATNKEEAHAMVDMFYGDNSEEK